ncbi:16S rRNA (uracil(1498)-N(3))-methyltransferase [Acetobacter oryzoeni]|uniref:Ribosomal RNA small subunit methyltransferase E n=1 Tax=Acetobacter oryzoeni TaxID=2500548 RepID=A0A5B9GPV1_9PROT|nr:16S rRNA (uracil(1498)-N(3))-methyltransferase [Acetobacter oryzoeni]MCP1201965.1 16S rRNA (uracil(1498)-N(3))-methyltransferase [Acetobacter oryzoeni]QEE85685.1 16S rRNA (uracil(1498)-N(3))-methyltransferase [Acetobacter oryzoeni]
MPQSGNHLHLSAQTDPVTMVVTDATAHLPRLYNAPEILGDAHTGLTLQIAPDQARYLGTVLRKKAGDHVRIFNANSGEWLARITEIRKDKGFFELERQLRAPTQQPALVLAFALLKRDATDLVLRMGTELGVTHFVPLITERTNTHRINPDRLHAIATEATEQCERFDVPHVESPQSFTDFLASWPQEHRLFAAIERGEDRAIHTPSLLPEAHAGDGFLVGPEGGLSDRECQMMLKYSCITPISLGPLVLRADTAVAAGLALIGCGLRSAAVLSQ